MPRWWTGPSVAQRQAQTRLAEAISQLGFVLPGNVTTRSYRCGKANCACHSDPPQLHGPYLQWSHQRNGKTVHANLTEEQLADYQPFLDNARRLRALVEELETLTLTMIESDPRWKRR